MKKVGRQGFPVQRLEKLEAIGFVFEPMRSRTFMAKRRAKMFPRIEANWNRHYQNLVRYNEENGNLIIGPKVSNTVNSLHARNILFYKCLRFHFFDRQRDGRDCTHGSIRRERSTRNIRRAIPRH